MRRHDVPEMKWIRSKSDEIDADKMKQKVDSRESDRLYTAKQSITLLPSNKTIK